MKPYFFWLSLEVGLNIFFLFNNKFFIDNRSNGPWDQFVSVKDITVELKNARSHEEFQHSLKRLEWLLPCQNDRGYFDEQTILAIMKKFVRYL